MSIRDHGSFLPCVGKRRTLRGLLDSTITTADDVKEAHWAKDGETRSIARLVRDIEIAFVEGDLRGRPAKRHRVAVACDHCRRRKIRCDGLQPLCSYCLDHDIACVYQKVPQRVHVSQSYLDTLVRQVEELQRTNACLGQQVLGTSGHGYRFLEQETPASSRRATSPMSPTQDTDVTPAFPLPGSRPGSKNSVTSTGEPAADETESVTDAMVCAGSPLSAGGSYFGRFSTLSFTSGGLQDRIQRSGLGQSSGPAVHSRGRSPAGNSFCIFSAVGERLVP
jgi:hypothetical protein